MPGDHAARLTRTGASDIAVGGFALHLSDDDVGQGGSAVGQLNGRGRLGRESASSSQQWEDLLLMRPALTYGAVSLWNDRPMYYAFSEDVLQVVQAYDIDPKEVALARRQSAAILPHWYDLPKWIWAPLPDKSDEQNKIIQSAVSGGGDVISMPRYYRPWEAAPPTLRKQLKKVSQLKYFSAADRKLLAAKMTELGLSPDQDNCIALTGRAWPLLAVFDPASLRLIKISRSR